MQSKSENNTVFNDSDTQETDYEYNFFNTPWDDRGQKSKICIIGLLCAIFVATMGIVINNLVIFYKGFQPNSLYSSGEINCNLVRNDKYRYAARLHSITSQELVCVGAMVSRSSVLANAVCLNSGPIRLYLGSLTNHHCKKGFSVDVIEPINHDGVVKKRLVLMTTRKSMIDCGDVVQLDFKSNLNRPASVIGRPVRGGRTLSLQPATLIPLDNVTSNILAVDGLNKSNLICVKHLSRCPVRAGDLLVQRGHLIGIASTSAQRMENNDLACFANLSVIRDELRDLIVDTDSY